MNEATVVRLVLVITAIIVLFVVCWYFSHKVTRITYDGYLDVVKEPDGNTAMLLEVNDMNVIEKDVIKLKVRRSGKYKWGDSQIEQSV